MGRFRRPLRSAKGSILNLSSVGSTRRAQNLSMYQGIKQLYPGVGAGAGRRRSACQRHRPGSHPQPYTTDERCPWKALGPSKCGTWRSASARSWRPSKRDIPFLSIGILPIYVKQRSFACCIPAFLDKLKNPAYTYSRQGFLERKMSFHWVIPFVSRTRRLFRFAITHQSKADTPCAAPPPGPWGISRHSLDVP